MARDGAAKVKRKKLDRKQIASVYRQLQKAWKRAAYWDCRRRRLEYRWMRLHGNPRLLDHDHSECEKERA